MPEPEVQKSIVTIQRLDKRRNPPEYVGEELPTTTVKIFSRGKQGTILSLADGPTIMGSIQFTGSYYEFAPGSYSLRVIRRSVYIGSEMSGKLNFEWKLRHSRLGTVDAIPFYKGSVPASRSAEAFGDPLRPLYAFGPGTVWHYFNPRIGTARVYASLEGVF